jgi:hypothetical protein
MFKYFKIFSFLSRISKFHFTTTEMWMIVIGFTLLIIVISLSQKKN